MKPGGGSMVLWRCTVSKDISASRNQAKGSYQPQNATKMWPRMNKGNVLQPRPWRNQRDSPESWWRRRNPGVLSLRGAQDTLWGLFIHRGNLRIWCLNNKARGTWRTCLWALFSVVRSGQDLHRRHDVTVRQRAATARRSSTHLVSALVLRRQLGVSEH